MSERERLLASGYPADRAAITNCVICDKKLRLERRLRETCSLKCKGRLLKGGGVAVSLLALLLAGALAGCATLHVSPGAGSLPAPDPACTRLSVQQRTVCEQVEPGLVVCGDRCYGGTAGPSARVCRGTVAECERHVAERPTGAVEGR